MSKHLFVQSLWTKFDSTNFNEASASFIQLIEKESRPLIINLNKLKYFNDMWPICVGPLQNNTDKKSWQSKYENRWTLIGVSSNVKNIMEMFGFLDGWVKIIEKCPVCQEQIDLNEAKCINCGSYDVIEWKPLN